MSLYDKIIIMGENMVIFMPSVIKVKLRQKCSSRGLIPIIECCT